MANFLHAARAESQMGRCDSPLPRRRRGFLRRALRFRLLRGFHGMVAGFNGAWRRLGTEGADDPQVSKPFAPPPPPQVFCIGGMPKQSKTGLLMNRTRLILTEEQIDGENPAYAAWQVMLDHAEGLDGDGRAAYIRHLPQHWRAVYTAFRLLNEVNNGGYHQFFWNDAEALKKETLEDLRLTSAHPFVLLFEEALDEYQRHDYPGEKAESANSWEGFTKAYKEGRMAILDEAFCKVPKTIATHLSDYIRMNRKMYANLTTARP